MQPSHPFTTYVFSQLSAVFRFLRTYAVECLLIALILYVCISRGLRFGLSIHDPDVTLTEGAVFTYAAIIPASCLDFLPLRKWLAGTVTEADQATRLWLHHASVEEASASSRNVSQPGLNSQSEATHAIAIQAPAAVGFDDFNTVAITDDPAPHISNLTLVLSPDYAQRKQLPQAIVRAKRQRVQNYLEAFAPAAQAEMRAYGIPASITLAQGLLESNAGDSKLARQSKNHFGIKCRSKCLGCTCRNYGDDTRYDMFRVFDDVSESYREHSLLLTSDRYKRLHTYGLDYKKWAHGLKACGYATDKRYAEKLIKIIEQLQLYQYDALPEV